MKQILDERERNMGTYYNVGDVVRKRHGKLPMEVLQVYGSNKCICRYLHSGQQVEDRHSNLVMYEGNETQTGEMNMLGKLFQVKETKEFGIGLAVNSAGKYVLEMKGENTIKVFAKDEVEVVMPYTFAVLWQNGQKSHFRGKAGILKKGDLVLETNEKNFRIGRVAAVDTKMENAKTSFKGVKLVAESLDEDEEVIED